METTYIEQMYGQEPQYLILHENGKVDRILKVIENKEEHIIRFFLFGGIEKVFSKRKINVKKEKSFRKYFVR